MKPIRSETITVGPAGADVCGLDSRAIQIAMDTLAYRGGGTVRVLPGEYALHDSVRLRSNVALVGDRDRTILRSAPVFVSPLAVDADIGERQIAPRDPSGFRPGMGVILRDRSKPNNASTMPLTIERIEGGVLHVNGYIEDDWTAEEDAIVLNYFPLIHGFEVENVSVDGFALDSRVDPMPRELAGLWGAGLYLRRVLGAEVRNVSARGCLGDGIRFCQSRDVIVEDCEAAHNSEYGMHPGAHTKRVRVSRCRIHHNGSDGLYICWGVQNSAFEDCDIHHNGTIKHRNGISIGHKDTDNRIERNRVHDNCKHGICFRRKTEPNGAHRNVLRDNVIEDNGTPRDKVPARFHDNPRLELMFAGIYVSGITHDLLLERNVIRETRAGSDRLQVNAVYLGPGVSRVTMVENRMEGHPQEAVVNESGSDDHRLQRD